MITIYTKNVCPYCVKAKNYLNMKGIEYESKNIEEDREARDFLVDGGYRSVPQIFVGKTILVEGGANELVRLSTEEINERIETIKSGDDYASEQIQD
jgi:glutaredoxin